MRPLNLGETLDASMKIVRARWRTLVTVMVVVALPIQLIDMLIISSTTDVYEVGTSFATDAGSGTVYRDQDAYTTGQLAIQLLGLLGSLLGTVACYRAIADSRLGRDTSVGDSLRFAAGRFGQALWLTILLAILLIPAFLLLVVPGIWLLVAWSVAVPAMLLEGRGGFVALKRSFTLVRGRWWATAGRLVIAYIMVAVATAAATFLLLLPASGPIEDTSFAALLLEHVAHFVVSLVTTPFLAAVVTLVYFDLRVRKEGFDVSSLGTAAVGAAGGFATPVPSGRDAFGNATTSVPPPAPRPYAPPTSPSGSWAPPVAPDAQRPSPPPDE